ncbi:hypothetical protein ABPG72_019595 [Tetrahymena utriculariae]
MSCPQTQPYISEENTSMNYNMELETHQYGNNNTHENFNQEQFNQQQFSSFLKTIEDIQNDNYPPQSEFNVDGPIIYSYHTTSNEDYSYITSFQNNTNQSTNENQSFNLTDYLPFYSQESSQQLENFQQQPQQLDENKQAKVYYKKIAKMLESKTQNYIENAHQDENYLIIKKWQPWKKSITHKKKKNIYKNWSGLSVICYPNHTFQSIANDENAEKIFTHFLQNTQDEIPFKFGEYLKNPQLQEFYQKKLDANIKLFNKACDFNKKQVQSLKDDQEMIDQISYFINNIDKKYIKHKQNIK